MSGRTLLNLIRKGGLTTVATATRATLATHEAENSAMVAQVATVAVAKLQLPTAAMKAEEETVICAWLALIEEIDSGIISEVLNRCRADAEVRAWFLRRADEALQPDLDGDDRRHCSQCANLTTSGLCLAAQRGEIDAPPTYHPADGLPRRCEGYASRLGERDRRPRCQRWPGLTVDIA